LIYGDQNLQVLHSFPTRRSSDLEVAIERERERVHAPVAGSAVGLAGQAATSLLGRGELVAGKPRLVDDEQGEPARPTRRIRIGRSEEHTSELQSRENLVCRLLLE